MPYRTGDAHRPTSVTVLLRSKAVNPFCSSQIAGRRRPREPPASRLQSGEADSDGVHRRRRVHKAFGTGAEPNGRVNHLVGENGETESPALESRKSDGSPRKRSEPPRNRESAPPPQSQTSATTRTKRPRQLKPPGPPSTTPPTEFRSRANCLPDPNTNQHPSGERPPVLPPPLAHRDRNRPASHNPSTAHASRAVRRRLRSTRWSFPSGGSRMHPTFFPFGPVAIKRTPLLCRQNTEHPCGGVTHSHGSCHTVTHSHGFRHTVTHSHTSQAARFVLRSCRLASRTSLSDLWRLRQHQLPRPSVFLPFTNTRSPRLARLLRRVHRMRSGRGKSKRNHRSTFECRRPRAPTRGGRYV